MPRQAWELALSENLMAMEEWSMGRSVDCRLFDLISGEKRNFGIKR